MKEVLIITGLPFRRQGNQSMIRFVNMFLSRGIKVSLYSSGRDKRGERVLEDKSFALQYVPKTRDKLHEIIKKCLFLLKDKQRAGMIKKVNNYYEEIKSETIVPPFGMHNKITMINKWAYFLLVILDNIIAFWYFILFHSKAIKAVDVIIAYEIDYTYTSKWLSFVYHKKYINKFQGVILAASNRDLLICKKYYPNNYYGINRADLCIMVNDGTDGEYYARMRGCDQIYFEPHGVNDRDYIDSSYPDFKKINDGKFIIFNNASGSKWKRSDRCIRFINLLDHNTKENIRIYTSYHAEDMNELKEYVNMQGLNDQVVFLDNLDHVLSNRILRNSHILMMTNDMSNLGNPVLESIYYGVPVVSLNDNSLSGFVTDGIDGVLLDIDDSFDRKLAAAIKKLYEDSQFYNLLKSGMKKNNSVHTVEYQQDKEFDAILKSVDN